MAQGLSGQPDVRTSPIPNGVPYIAQKISLFIAKSRIPVNQPWSAVSGYFFARRQRARNMRILSHMNDQNLRDLGPGRSQGGTKPALRMDGVAIHQLKIALILSKNDLT